MALCETLANRGFMINRSIGDGHCLIHYLRSSWNSQLSHLPAINVEHIKAKIFIETVENPKEYVPFLNPGSNLELFSGLRQFLLYKRYNLSFGDLVPVIISNAFNVGLDILNQNVDNCIQEISVAPRSNNLESLAIHRYRDHYNGITFCDQHVKYSGDFPALVVQIPDGRYTSEVTEMLEEEFLGFHIWCLNRLFLTFHLM